MCQTHGVVKTFNLAMHFLTLSSYAVTGHLTRAFADLFIWILPAILLATLLGNRLYTRLSEAAFRRMVLVLLLGSGCALVIGSLR